MPTRRTIRQFLTIRVPLPLWSIICAVEGSAALGKIVGWHNPPHGPDSILSILVAASSLGSLIIGGLRAARMRIHRHPGEIPQSKP